MVGNKYLKYLIYIQDQFKKYKNLHFSLSTNYSYDNTVKSNLLTVPILTTMEEA